MWLFSGKSCFSRAKVVVLGQSNCIGAKIVVFREGGCIRANWLYTSKSG